MHWKIWFLYNIEILRALRFKSSCAFLKLHSWCMIRTVTSRAALCAHMVTGNTLRPKQNGRHFADVFLYERVSILSILYIKILNNIQLKCVPKGRIDIKSVSVQVMVWQKTKQQVSSRTNNEFPDSRVHGASMGPIWGREDPGGPHVGLMNFAIWVGFPAHVCVTKPQWTMQGNDAQWVINYHQHNYHQQKMAAASSGKEQQLAISLFLGLPDSYNLHNI